MGQTQQLSIEVPAEVAAGGNEGVGHLTNKYLVVSTAAFTATIKLEGSVDGTVWHELAATIAAGDVTAIPVPWKYVRCNTTAYTSGTPAAHICGEVD